MVTETAVVGVLLNGHNLDAVIAVAGNVRQYFFLKFEVAAHLLFLLGHADVAFINQQRSGVGLEGALLEFIGFLRSPYLCAEDFGLLVLHHAVGPGRNAFSLSAVPSESSACRGRRGVGHRRGA